jgi:YD repeat-containing protein
MRANSILKLGVAAVTAAAIGTSALATETITYTYDARGRLVKVERVGTVNNNEKTEYEHDRANNRKRVKTTGA